MRENGQCIMTPLRRACIYVLSHILSTFCAKSSELNFVRAWLVDFNYINPTPILSRQKHDKINENLRSVDHIAFCDLPLYNLPVDSRLKASRELSLDLNSIA